MAKALRLTMLCGSLALAPYATSCEVAFRNSSNADLVIAGDRGHAVIIGPEEKRSVTLPVELRIEFGAEAFEYSVSPAQRSVLCPGESSTPAVLRADSDAVLWLEVPGEQPEGFPLRPAGKFDLTGSPSNPSFGWTRWLVTQSAVAAWAPAYPAPRLDR